MVPSTSYFEALAEQLTLILGVDHALIVEALDERRGLALGVAGVAGSHALEYCYSGTPCEHVRVRGKFSCTGGLSKDFPAARGPVRGAAEGYVGIVLRGADESVLGHICVVSLSVLTERQLARARAILEVVASHAARELERQRCERLMSTRIDRLEQENAVLTQTIVAANASSEAKSRFLANMSHEIRTPLTAILGFVDILSERVTDSDGCEALRTIQSNGEHLLSVLNDILDISKIEAGRLEVERQPYSVAAVLLDVRSLMGQRAQSKGLTLEISLETPIPEVCLGDATRVRQCLYNLVGNAIKFTDRGGVRIEVRTVHDLVPRMEVDVVDTGPGIPASEAGRLFGAFTQGNSSTTRRFGGTGLGLAISRELARTLGGDLTLHDSRPGVGSRFRFTFATGPLDDTVSIAPEMLFDTVPTAVVPKPSESTSVLPFRILVAEDGPDNQRIIRHFLQRRGAEVEVCENGRIAIERAVEAEQDSDPFDLILMDMSMPEMDGYEATERLRAAGFETPIVALTANVMVEDRRRCFEVGCDAFLSKPINRVEFLEVVRGLLNSQTRPPAQAAD